jgi:opacity protein-like surface antigen
MRNFILTAAFLFCLSGSASADLILHYMADNSSIDSSGHGHDGTLFNGATYATGQLGQAFSFDGTDDYLAGPVIPEINPNSFSIALWVKAVPESGLRLLADSSHGGNRGGSFNWDGFALQLNGGGAADFAFGNGSTFPHVTSTTVVADNTFHHLAATFDGSLMSIYVDGALDNTASFSGTPTVSGRPFRLGNHDQLTSRALNGLLDDVRLYDEVLTAGQVNGLANVPEPASGTIFGISLAVIALVRRRHPNASSRNVE